MTRRRLGRKQSISFNLYAVFLGDFPIENCCKNVGVLHFLRSASTAQVPRGIALQRRHNTTQNSKGLAAGGMFCERHLLDKKTARPYFATRRLSSYAPVNSLTRVLLCGGLLETQDILCDMLRSETFVFKTCHAGHAEYSPPCHNF